MSWNNVAHYITRRANVVRFPQCGKLSDNRCSPQFATPQEDAGVVGAAAICEARHAAGRRTAICK